MTRPVAILPDPVLAGFVATFLEEHGVRALDVQASSNVTQFGGDVSYFVEVADEDLPRAREVLASTDLRKWLLVPP